MQWRPTGVVAHQITVAMNWRITHVKHKTISRILRSLSQKLTNLAIILGVFKFE